MSVQQSQSKDGWDKLKILSETVIAIAALVFAAIYNSKQQAVAEANVQLARSNFELAQAQLGVAKAQVESALIQPLSSNDAKQRAIALYLAEALDQPFAVKVALVSLNDPSEVVQKTATIALASLSRNAPEAVKQQAEKGLERNDLMNELRAKGFLEKLSQAQGYHAGGGIEGRETALRLYREVERQLSANTRNKLDQGLLQEAKKDDQEGNRDDALRKYATLFAVYRQAN